MTLPDEKLCDFEEQLLVELKGVVGARGRADGRRVASRMVTAGPHRRQRVGRRAAYGLAAAVAVAAGAALPIVLSAAEEPDAASAAPILTNAAAMVEKQSAQPVPAKGKFVYVRSVGKSRESGSDPLCGFVWEVWHSFDPKQPGREVRVEGVVMPGLDWRDDPRSLRAQPGCKRAVREIDSLMQGNQGMPNMPEWDGDWGQPTPTFVAGLPDTPEAMLQASIDWSLEHPALLDADDKKAFADSSSNVKWVYAFDNLARLLVSHYPHLDAKVRATALRAMALVPGVRDLGPAKDVFGRPGVAFAGPKEDDEEPADEPMKYVIDPKTGNFLGSNHSEISAVSTSAVVDNAEQRPTR